MTRTLQPYDGLVVLERKRSGVCDGVVVLFCVISWPRKDDSQDVLLSDALVVRLRIESDAGCWTD